MEVYRNSIGETVTLPLPPEARVAGLRIDAYLVDGNQLLHVFDTVVVNEEGAQVVLPWLFVRQDRDLVVEWNVGFTSGGEAIEITENSYVSVVTPYISLTQARALNDVLAEMPEDQLKEMERRVRLVIDAYTGQKFGKGRQTVLLPISELNKKVDRLLEIESITINQKTYPYDEYQNLWGSSSYHIKSDTFDGVIWAPPSRLHADSQIEVIGIWGWEKVPQEVVSAAIILIDEYSCDESIYRDRYLTSVKYSDARFDISPEAFIGTGNVKADQLLSKFKSNSWMVI